MPSPPPESEFDFRSRARSHVTAAKELLSVSTPRTPFYACLELRMAIEALAYDAFQQYSFEVPADAMNKWTPKQILDELVYIDPDVELTSSITINVPELPNAQAYEIELGEVRRLSSKWANKAHNALGNFLHQPTIKQLTQLTNDLDVSARKKANEVITEIDRLLSSPVSSFRAHRLVEIKCDCGCRIARDVEFLNAQKRVICSSCGCEYLYSLDAEKGGYNFIPRKALWECNACKTSNSFPFHELKEGNSVSCSHCKKSFEIAMVLQLKEPELHR